MNEIETRKEIQTLSSWLRPAEIKGELTVYEFIHLQGVAQTICQARTLEDFKEVLRGLRDYRNSDVYERSDLFFYEVGKVCESKLENHFGIRHDSIEDIEEWLAIDRSVPAAVSK